MSDDELGELQNTENWDFEHVQKGRRTRPQRAIVSVAFSREDFEKVGKCAEQLGKRTSEFIREAALEKAECEGRLAVLSSFSSSTSHAVFSDRVFPTTRVAAQVVELSGELRRRATGEVTRG